MTSRTTERFRKSLAQLPVAVQLQAKDAFRQFQKDPYYPSLRFKRVHSTEPIFSVRINISCRALGIQQNTEIVWFWIGSHNDYERIISSL